MHTLFGKQEQESILESRNQAKIPKDSESCRRKVRVAEPSVLAHVHPFQINILLGSYRKNNYIIYMSLWSGVANPF